MGDVNGISERSQQYELWEFSQTLSSQYGASIFSSVHADTIYIWSTMHFGLGMQDARCKKTFTNLFWNSCITERKPAHCSNWIHCKLVGKFKVLDICNQGLEIGWISNKAVFIKMNLHFEIFGFIWRIFVKLCIRNSYSQLGSNMKAFQFHVSVTGKLFLVITKKLPLVYVNESEWYSLFLNNFQIWEPFLHFVYGPLYFQVTIYSYHLWWSLKLQYAGFQQPRVCARA